MRRQAGIAEAVVQRRSRYWRSRCVELRLDPIDRDGGQKRKAARRNDARAFAVIASRRRCDRRRWAEGSTARRSADRRIGEPAANGRSDRDRTAFELRPSAPLVDLQLLRQKQPAEPTQHGGDHSRRHEQRQQ